MRTINIFCPHLATGMDSYRISSIGNRVSLQ